MKTERAWKRAASRDNPVAIKAMAAMRVIINDNATITNNDIIANTGIPTNIQSCEAHPHGRLWGASPL